MWKRYSTDISSVHFDKVDGQIKHRVECNVILPLVGRRIFDRPFILLQKTVHFVPLIRPHFRIERLLLKDRSYLLPPTFLKSVLLRFFEIKILKKIMSRKNGYTDFFTTWCDLIQPKIVALEMKLNKSAVSYY